jgi:hypothetical protein
LWEVARAHVQPRGVSEEQFLATTPFLSFTEDRERAETYAKGRTPGTLVPCAEQFGEDTIVFELETNGMRQVGQEGVYVLDYTCDYSRVQPLMPGDDGLAQAAAVRCEFCDPENQVVDPRVGPDGRLLHRIQLLRVATFLRGHPERARYAGALELAERDREWLLYPMDYVHRLRGFSSRIPVARIWEARRYTFVPNGV